MSPANGLAIQIIMNVCKEYLWADVSKGLCVCRPNPYALVASPYPYD